MWSGGEKNTSQEAKMPRLLVVDDEESICFSMSEYFSLQGYRVDTAQELDEAEKLIVASEYKVDIIKMIRGQNPQTRIVVLTAYGSTEMEDEARRCGADAFLRKPKPLSQVAQVIQGLLESPSKHVARPA
jgi:DNA-binding NtrC family response regulator